MALLEVDGLVTEFATDEGLVRAVDDVSFSVEAGATVGIVGESGCGKSVTALSIMRLLPQPTGRIAAGAVRFQGQDLAQLPAEFRHEPERALGSGPDGLELTRRILRDARRFLLDSGLLVVEVGNSWLALEEAYPLLPFTWLEFEHGGHGVFALTAKELQDYGASQG